jgi:hypothetical protein
MEGHCSAIAVLLESGGGRGPAASKRQWQWIAQQRRKVNMQTFLCGISKQHSHASPCCLWPPCCCAGALQAQPDLATRLQGMLTLRAAGWQQQEPAPAAVDTASAAAAAAEAAADALASQLTLGSGLSPAASQSSTGSCSLDTAGAAPAPPADSWDYLAPDGSGVFGPFSLEQLQFWVQQGHMPPDVKVGGCRQWVLSRGGGRLGRPEQTTNCVCQW